MAEFKEWYSDDGRVFNREFRAMFSQCTINHELSIQEMLRLTSDVRWKTTASAVCRRQFWPSIIY